MTPQSRIPGHRARSVFRAVVVATLLAAFGQITLGGIVRVTGSGLGCPDWPLCHGQLIPPFNVATLIEYSHRLSGSSLGILAIATTVMAIVYFRSNRWILLGSVTGLILVIAAGVLGGVTVLTELKWWVRLIHLAIAEVVVAAIIVAAVAAWLKNSSDDPTPSDGELNRLNMFVFASLIGTLGLILSGSYIVGAGAGSSCGTWPLCNGAVFPDATSPAIHMGHRIVAALIGVILGLTVFYSIRLRNATPGLAFAGRLLAATFIVQIFVGAATVWGGFSAEMKAIHLSAATLVWMALLLLAALVYVPQFVGRNRAGDPERMTTRSHR